MKPTYLQNLLSVLYAFLKLGITSFGGPAAHLGYFRKEFVENRAWFTESQYAQLVAIAQFLPGPASSQVGFAVGLLRAGWLGALVAFISFTLPSVAIMLGVAWFLPSLQSDIALMLTAALKVLACIIVTDAVLAMFRQFCLSISRASFAILAFIVLMLYSVNALMLMVLLISAIVGSVIFKNETQVEFSHWQAPFSNRLAYFLIATFVIIFGLSFWYLGDPTSLSGVFSGFYQTGSLVFGGGHVVLPLLEEQWLSNNIISKADFLAGYGAAQMLPGPLFSFAAYIAALLPVSNQTAAVCMALVGIFLPGFLLMAAALPIWVRLSQFNFLRGAIIALNAAVVGILASVLLDPVLLSGIQQWPDVLIIVIAVLLLQTKKLAMIWVILLSLVVHLAVNLISG
ncbi:MAG: chromate efflux transporter [Gammaproteobacteria bacterium]|nr:chromate efflux transporter [Gammaproteobacteria bacterium]NNJ72316.1 chromate efflux transporter [Enterobacterales bacterium]